jgi:hypothetical protein
MNANKKSTRETAVLNAPNRYGGKPVMRGFRVSMHRFFVVSGLSLALASTAAVAQQSPTTSNPTTVSGQTQTTVQTTTNPDVTRGELVNLDQFLDEHPEIDRQLRANPSLINDNNYLQATPQLQAYLTNHPQVRTQLTQNPAYFMQREDRLQARVAQEERFDQYLADHKDVDKDVRKNQRVLNDSGYLKKHHDLDEFLKANPDVRVVVVNNPNYFQDRDRDRVAMNGDMNARLGENRTVAGGAGAGASAGATTGANAGANVQMTKEHSDRMDKFLDKHQDVAKDLHDNPALVRDDGYLDHHKDLRKFFNQNPGLRSELAENRAYFEQRDERMHDRMTTTKPPTTKSPASNVDQRQNLTPTTH